MPAKGGATSIPRALTIATSDSGGGAGIQADLKAFAAAGVYGMSALVALTAQNTKEVTAVHELPTDFIRAQLHAVFDDIGVDAAKTGMLFSRAIIDTVADFLHQRRVPLVVDPVMVASSGAKLLLDDAVDTLVSRLFPLATVVTPNLNEAVALAGFDGTRRRARRAAARARRAGGDRHRRSRRRGRRPPVRRRAARRDPGRAPRRRRDARRRLHALGDARGAAREGRARSRTPRARRRALPLEAVRNGLVEIGGGEGPVDVLAPEGSGVSAGSTLARLREQRPLVHQITNYVVMNETANATLALGALPVMAHAREEVEEMVGLAGALVLNIGTLSPHWVEAMLAAGKAANARGIPVVLDPVGAGATRYRTETAKRLLDEIDVTVLRGNAGEVATLVGVKAEVRGVESIGAAGDPAELAREAARTLELVASVTGPVDHVSDGERSLAVANGHELLATVTGTGCMSSAITGCFLAANPSRARGRRRGARGVRRRGRGRGRGRQGPRHVPRRRSTTRSPR